MVSAMSEHVFVRSRYVFMESLAISAPVSRLGDVNRGAARARTPASVISRRDLELERVIGRAEANLSAQADQAHSQVWLPGPYGRSRWPRRAGPATPQGTPRAYRRGREQVHAESLGESPARGGWLSTASGGSWTAGSRSRCVRSGTTIAAAARWRRARGPLAREGRFRRPIGPSLSPESVRSTAQPLWRHRRSQEWRLRAAQPAEAGDARGVARTAPDG